MEIIEESITIPAHALSSAALRARPLSLEEAALRPADAALAALTDFNRESPICVAPDRVARDALADMARLAIHALLVIDPTPGDRRELLGLLTVPWFGQRHASGGSSIAGFSGPSTLRVEDLMTPREELALVHYDSLRSLRVRDLHFMFQGTGLTHVLVIEGGEEATGDAERAEDGVSMARGIISRAGVDRRLGAMAGEMRIS